MFTSVTPARQPTRRPRLRPWLPLLLLAALLAALPAQAIERRKPQFQTEPAYLFVPFPYSLPGIGEGIAWSVLGANLLETPIDAYGLVLTGDAEGHAIGVEDIHLLPERLILNLWTMNLNRAAVNSYETRGMASRGDDYRLLEANKVRNDRAELRLSLAERRFELFLGTERFEVAVVRAREPDGTLITEFLPPFQQVEEANFAGVLLDYTDDFADPRRGVRLGVTARHSQPARAVDPDFVVWDYALSGYVPLGRLSTLVLHYFQSDADVRRAGNTDSAAILAELGLDCAAGNAACLAVQQQLLQQTINERRNGTATTLGGQERLRSYPMDRFQGAHTIFYGAELRWNLTEEVTPFDYFIWKDVRTNVQLAFFYETGSVGETRAEVGDTFRSSYGAGLRMVSGSGFVYRADVATGEEGSELTIIFSYPY